MLPTWLTAFLPCILTGHPRPSWRTALTFPTTADEKLHSADIQPISLLTSTAHSLKELLDSKKATSRGIIEQCMGQIDTHNEQGMRLRAIIPELSRETILSFADELDMEREQGRLRGPFHGVPIIIKDTINTSPEMGMRTTLGSYSLYTARPYANASVVSMLTKNGIIVIGKTNLSEFGATKCNGARAGFSSVGGQTQSVYISGGVMLEDCPFGNTNPGGSSSGSAVGVAAGFSPWSIGAETDGSLNSPASRSSLYALKPTVGSINNDGVFILTETFDSLGGMTKTVADLAVLTDLLISTAVEKRLPSRKLLSSLRTSWHGLSVGFVDINLWRLPDRLLKADDNYKEQTAKAYRRAMKDIEAQGGIVHHSIALRQPSDFKFEGKSGYSTIRNGEFRPLMNRYLQSLESADVRSLAELIEYNNKHPELEFCTETPNQSKLLEAQAFEISDEKLQQVRSAMRTAAGPEELDRIMQERGLDAIIAPMDSPIATLAALSGYPAGTMPLGYLEPSGRPFGLCVLARANEESKIISIMSAWESVNFPQRRLPKPLLDAESSRVSLQ